MRLMTLAAAAALCAPMLATVPEAAAQPLWDRLHEYGVDRDNRYDDRYDDDIRRDNDGWSRARGRGFVEIGSRRVPDRFVRQAINVNRDRRFSQIRICAERRAIEFDAVRIAFANGRRADVSVPRILRAGDCTRIGRVDGPRRRIDRIGMHYRSARAGGRQPIVRIDAR